METVRPKNNEMIVRCTILEIWLNGKYQQNKPWKTYTSQTMSSVTLCWLHETKPQATHLQNAITSLVIAGPFLFLQRNYIFGNSWFPFGSAKQTMKNIYYQYFKDDVLSQVILTS